MLVQREININASPEAVFNYLSDLPKHSEWAAHPLQIKPDSEAPLAVGSTLTSNSRMMGKDNQDHLTIKELILNKKIVFEAIGGAGTFVHQIEIKDNGSSGSQVSKSVDAIQMSFPLNILKPLFPLLGGKSINADLKKIKANLEQN